MLRINPFRALRPQPNHASAVASVPYDVVNTAEARALAEGNPRSFLHVIRPEIDLADDVDAHDDAVYETAAANLRRFIEDGVLVQEEQPKMYLYRQVREHRAQIGVVCCCHIDDYVGDVIRKHEKTRPDKEDDRTRHMLTLRANPGPVFLTYRARPAIDRLVNEDVNDRPLFHFNAPDGVTHTVWVVHEPKRYLDAFSGLEAAYVADGHHRSAAAARAGAELRAAHPDQGADAEHNWFLTVLFPDEQLTILAYNRLLRDLGDRSVDEVLVALGSLGVLTDTDDAVPDATAVFCIYLGGRWRRLELDPASIDRDDPIASLDVDLLQRRILEPVFGIGDPRTDARIDFVGGARGTDELARRVDAGEAAAAISMYPTSIKQLLEVSDAGLVMPPKSTWFEPKLLSGLFVHLLD